MLTPAPCPFYHIETYVIAQDLAKNIGWSASTLTLYNVTNMTEKLPHYLCNSLQALFASPRARSLYRPTSSWPEAGYTAGYHAELEPCAKIPRHFKRAKPQPATCRIACHKQQHRTPVAAVRKGSRAK